MAMVEDGREATMSVASPDVAAFVFREAQLLDERRFDDWLALFVDDCRYEIPYPDGPQQGPRVAIAQDDRERLTERIWRLQSGEAHAQNPPSETVRMVGNLMMDADGSADTTVTGTFVVAEVRRDVQRLYAGRYTFDLRHDGPALRIARKRVELVNAGVPLGNLTFVL